MKIIKTPEEYGEALAEIEALMDMDPDPGTREFDHLELLSLLVQNYESQTFQITPPDPIEAILFRMEQQGLAPRDLIPYLGSRSKVSEVLAGKRPLSLEMVRALHFGLGIPAKVLLQEPDPANENDLQIEWDKFPLKEMVDRGWIRADLAGARKRAEQILRTFVEPIGIPTLKAVLYRKSRHVRSARSMDDYALTAWSVRVMRRAMEETQIGEYRPETVDLNFLRKVAQLSSQADGPVLARHFLMEHGIPLIIEPHLPRTHLDGAALLLRDDNRPVIGLTLRYDRLDNFWFSLMHELVHIWQHLDADEVTEFFDDLEVDLEIDVQDDPLEHEADELAREALIPQDVWEDSPARFLRSPSAAEHLAKRLQIHPAIVAGRIRYEHKVYRLLSNLVGQGEVRRHFPEIDWSK
jgi:HTH-type transcriptional regulator / antitoxin HigA